MFNFLKSKPKKPKTLGQWGEEFAQKEYKRRGYSIVESNFSNKKGLRLGEIDFIAKSQDSIVFVEVKTRTPASVKFGSGAEAVDVYKQRKILRAVKVFLQKRPEYQPIRPQIDVCLVIVDLVDKSRNSVIIISNAVEDWN